MNIVIIEPYYTGSHRDWAKGLQKYSKHRIEILSLKGQFWKWRMHGGAVSLAQEYQELDYQPDLILATDMLDLTTFLALTRDLTADIPTAIYFHENQIVYPWSPTDRDIHHKRDRHYGFINYASALAADHMFYNSHYHLDAWFNELPRFLKHFPDYNGLENVEKLRQKSSVLPLGLDLQRFDALKSERQERQAPLVLWNHRWEFDKNPDDFFNALFLLQDEGIDFQVAVLGENFSKSPDIFNRAKERFGERIVHFGYADSFADYAHWLWQADILPVTSIHDFFGASVMEAIYCGCYPILPKRLTYPELMPEELHAEHFYTDFEELVEKLRYALGNNSTVAKKDLNYIARPFQWGKIIEKYDNAFQALV